MNKAFIPFTAGMLFLIGCVSQKPADTASEKTSLPRQSHQQSTTLAPTCPQKPDNRLTENCAVKSIPKAFPRVITAATPPAESSPEQKTSRQHKPIRALVIVQNHCSQKNQLQGLGNLLAGELANRNILAVDPAQFSSEWKNSHPDLNSLPKSSLTGLAQTLRTPYIITASLNRLDSSTFGTAPNTFTQYHLKLTLNISTNDGAVFDSWTAAVKSRPMTALQLQQNSSFALNQLLDKAAVECAEWLSMRLDSREKLPDSAYQYVLVAFNCNIPGADIEIDGTAVGTAPARCKVSEGLHTLRISYPYFIEYRKQVNFTEGASFNIVLEMSNAGIARWQSQELFKTLLQRLKDSGATDDIVRRVLADGQAQFLKNSHFKWDGAIEALSIFDQNNIFRHAYMNFSNDDLRRWGSQDNLLRIVRELRQAGVNDRIIRKIRREGNFQDYNQAKFLWDDRTEALGVRSPSGKNFIIK